MSILLLIECIKFLAYSKELLSFNANIIKTNITSSNSFVNIFVFSKVSSSLKSFIVNFIFSFIYSDLIIPGFDGAKSSTNLSSIALSLLCGRLNDRSFLFHQGSTVQDRMANEKR